MKSINPGDLTAKITIQNKKITQGAELNAIEKATDWLTVWAQPLSHTSREFYRLSQNNSEISRVFRIRYVAGVTSRQRVKYGSEILEIVGQPENEGERNRSLLIACKGLV